MDIKDAKTPAPFSVMSGGREEFIINNGKKYSVKPMSAAHVEEFMKDNPIIGGQFFSLANEDSRAVLDKWLGEVTVKVDDTPITAQYCLNEAGETMTLKKAMIDGWDIVDFKKYIRKLCDISG